MDPTQDALLKSGIAGIFAVFALLLVKSMFDFLKGRKNHAAGEKSTEFWQHEFRTITAQIMLEHITPIFERQASLLGKLEMIANRQTEILLAIQSRMGDVKDDTAKLREGQHDFRNQIQSFILDKQRPS